MLNKKNISSSRQKLIVYIVLSIVTFAIYWNVNKYDFIILDDHIYVTQNSHIQSEITLEGIRWAFGTTYAEFWHPLTWISLMFDYQLYNLNAGGYHLTNLILHIMSALLLFWLFNRMTGNIWRSAFVAALFALHPLHVESVAWIAERKDVLSACFWMLTLCLYVYYTEKPVVRRYLLVLFSFTLALMSKSIVVTLPMILILLDYWPLERFKSHKSNLVLWQLKEKIPFFILSAVFSIITLYAQIPSGRYYQYSLSYRLANASVNFVTYLEKTFLPHDMAIFYPFPTQIISWQLIGTSLLIIIITFAVVVMVKRLPYLFVGWMWYAIIILPVIGILQFGKQSMADRYHYLPSVGIAVMLAWGIPSLIKSENVRKIILFPASLIFLAIMAFLTWQQCHYWKSDFELFNHAVLVTKDNCLAHNSRGIAYGKLGQYKPALSDFSEAIRLKPDYSNAYNNRGLTYLLQGEITLGCHDAQKACELGNCKTLNTAKRNGNCR
jgi:tetratricopeptide (TPR) repeat protein